MDWRITPATGAFTFTFAFTFAFAFTMKRKLVYDRQWVMLTQRRAGTEVSSPQLGFVACLRARFNALQ